MDDLVGIIQGLAPGLAGVLVVVVLFLRHQNVLDERAAETMKSIAADCHSRQREAQESFERALAQVIDVKRESNGRLEKKLDEVCVTNRSVELAVTKLAGLVDQHARDINAA